MSKFFSYIFGIYFKPKKTIEKIVAEPCKKIMTIYAVVWDNLLMILIMTIVIIFRMEAWDPEHILPLSRSIIGSVKILVLCNVGILFVALLHHLDVRKYFTKRFRLTEPSLFYPYFTMSSYLLVLLVIAVIRSLWFYYVGDNGLDLSFGALLIASHIAWGFIVYRNRKYKHIRKVFAVDIVLIGVSLIYYVFWAWR